MAMENAPMKNWELTLYELQRTPQEPITDGTEIAVSPRSLQSELKCPICLDILKMTMTTKECLHRFCSECIVTALRNGNKECPTCRKKLVSKRSLRCDPNFDALIAKIYPSREEYEAHQNKVLAKLNKQHMNAAISRSLDNNSQHHHGGGFEADVHFRSNNRRQLDALRLGAGGPNQADSIVSEDDATSMTGSLNQRHSHVNSDTESGLDTNSVGGASSIGASDSIRLSGAVRVMPGTAISLATVASAAVVPEIELLLKPYPQQPTTKRDSSSSDRGADYSEQRTSVGGSASPRASSDVTNHQDTTTDLTPAVKYLKAPSITTVDHLSRYLSVRLNLQRLSKDITENDQHFALFFYNESNGEYERLQPHLTIEEVSQSYWNGLHNLDLYYQREPF